MSHAFVSGLVVGWVTFMLAQAVALWLLERWIDGEKRP